MSYTINLDLSTPTHVADFLIFACTGIGEKICSSNCQNGAPLQRVVELSHLIISRSSRYTWSKSTTDFAILARLRWIAGHSTQKLAQQFQVTEWTIRGYLSMLRHSDKLQSLDLSENELNVIQNKIKRELNYEQAI